MNCNYLILSLQPKTFVPNTTFGRGAPFLEEVACGDEY